MRALSSFFRANPQAFILLLICVVLGIGTFLAVVFGIAASGSTTTSGEPTGSSSNRVIATWPRAQPS